MKKLITTNNLPIPTSLIERRIYVIRGQEVMLSQDLAELYQTETRSLIQAVKRNLDRFPQDFMFQLNSEEYTNLKSQSVISSWGGARRSFPYAFTEHGVVMLSSILNSQRAIQMNIFIVRAFIQLRKMLAEHAQLSKRVTKLENTQKFHNQVLLRVVEDIKKIKNPPTTNAIGFRWRKK